MAKGRGLAAGLIALVLAGCAAGGPLEPPKASGIEGPALSASDGSPAPVTQWGPSDPGAVILALHGYGDHGSSTFGKAAEFWAAQGITTIAPDQRGFGRSPSRGHWPGADGMIADAGGFAAQIRERHACAPLIVLGHSMGGGVVMAAGARGLQADGLVLAAPAIWGGDALNPFHRLLAWSVALFAPDERFPAKASCASKPATISKLCGRWAATPCICPRHLPGKCWAWFGSPTGPAMQHQRSTCQH